jgi:4-amino-4-deoxy-L-arabinose transferase-like glycosyltransferase
MMELFNLVPVREAYRDHHWLMPTLNGVPRLEKPPLPVWIPAGLATLLGNDSLWILRLPSVLLALLASFAIYTAGLLFFHNPDERPDRSRLLAILAAISLPVMLVFNREARLASYDIYAAAFITCGAAFLAYLAEAGADPAQQPRFGKWSALVLGAGIATGLSVMSKGPVPAATVMLPLGLWLLIYHRRWPVWIGVLAAAIISVGVFLPWLIIIGQRYPDAWHRWYTEFMQFGTGNAENPAAAGTYQQLHKNHFYYLAFLLWVAPLTPTLIAGLILPFLPSHGEPPPSARERRGRWLFWLILVFGLLLISIPSEKKPRYALQLFPFAALLCAAVWQEFARLPAARRIEPAAAIMLVAQALFFILPGMVGAIGILWLAARWPIPHAAERLYQAVSEGFSGGGSPHAAARLYETLLPMASPWLIPPFLLLAGLGLYLWRAQFRRQWTRALIALTLCCLAFGLTTQTAYRLDPSTHTNSAAASTDAAMDIAMPTRTTGAAGGEVYTFASGDVRPWLSTLFFANHILPEETPQSLAAIANARPAQPIYIIALTDAGHPPGAQAEQFLSQFEQLTGRHREELEHWPDDGRRTALFRFPPASAPH